MYIHYGKLYKHQPVGSFAMSANKPVVKGDIMVKLR